MKNTNAFWIKLFDLLEKMSVYEQNKLMKYVRSPFFNEVEEIVELLHFYLSFFKKDKPIFLSKEEIWQSVFANTPYNDVRFRRLNSDLSKLAENFLAQLAFQQYPSTANNYFLRIANERDINKAFYTAQKNALMEQQKWPLRNAEFHFEQYRLETELHLITEKNERTTHNLLPAVEHLDKFYLSEKLRFYCTLLSHKNVVNAADEMLFIKQILEHLQTQTYHNVPAIEVYYQALLGLIYPQKEEHYHQLKSLLQQYTSNFTAEEGRNLYILAQNYCIKKVNAGNSHFLKELLHLYKQLISNKLIFKASQNQPEALSPWTYKNIITAALRVGELQWALHFIEDFKNNVPLEYRENAYIYNLSKYHFYLKNYDKVIELLIDVNYQGVFYMLDAKSLLLKTYYETHEDAALTSLMDSFKVLLNRKKMVAPNYRKIYKNLIKYVKKLRDIRDGNKQNIEILEKGLESNKDVADITWLHEKIAELKQ